MQMYANLFKINEKCYFSSILQWILICLFYLIGLVGGFKTYTQNLKFINYANVCILIQNQRQMLPFLYFAADLDSVCYI